MKKNAIIKIDKPAFKAALQRKFEDMYMGDVAELLKAIKKTSTLLEKLQGWYEKAESGDLEIIEKFRRFKNRIGKDYDMEDGDEE